MAFTPVFVTAYTAANGLGRGRDAIFESLAARRTGLTPCDLDFVQLSTYVGRVRGLEAEPVSATLEPFDCRNNRLAQVALQQDGFDQAVAAARERYGAKRVAVIIGTSTSGILETETGYRQRNPQTGALPEGFSYRHSHSTFSIGDFVRRYLGLAGPALVISTACSSSAKAFASAHRMMMQGLCEAAVVGGVDSLCGTTLHGFSSLGLVAQTPCRPADTDRHGISIGEGAGFALLERTAEAPTGSRIALLGYGESADAYHMSTPHPEGQGARLAMEQALQSAGLSPGDIDYINLHGTASKINDAMEDHAVSQLFGAAVPCSSTKGWTGHTLGAAGITEAVIACLSIEHSLLPGSLNTEVVDPTFRSAVLLKNREQRVDRVLSNSFGFGGSNCSLVFGRL